MAETIYGSLQVLNIPQPIHRKLCSISPNNPVYGVERLSSNDSADNAMSTSDIECMQHLGLAGACGTLGEVVSNDQHLEQHIVSSVLHEVGDFMLRI